MRKRIPCLSVDPQTDAKCWAAEHDTDEGHWAMVKSNDSDQPKLVVWKDNAKIQ